MAIVFRVLGVVVILVGVLYGFVEVGTASSDLQQFMAVAMTLGIILSSLVWFFMGEVVGLLAEIRDRLPASQQVPATESIQQVQEEGRPA